MIRRRKQTIGFPLRFACSAIALLIFAGSCMISAGAKKAYISEVTIAAGEDALTTLESKGYSVLFQGMNLVTSNGTTVYLGYKKGTTAITNFVVSTQKSSTITYGSISYKSVSSISLNEGTDGTPIYLYYTNDSSAGGKITSLDTVSGFTEQDEVVSLRNDGSSPVRMNDGTLANFDKGIDGNELYLLMYRSSEIKQYISNACVVTGSTKAETVNSAASKGCDYYLDKDMSSGNTVAYIAYQRTSDKNNAITKLDIDGTSLSFDKSKQASSYLLDISNDKLFNGSFTLGDWAGVYASYDKSVSKSSSEYKSLQNSTVNCSCVLAGSSGIYALYEGDVQSTVKAEETTTTEEATTGEAVTDEYFGIDKSVTTTVADDNPEGKTTASAISKGSVIAVSCFSALIILILIGAVIYRKKGRGKKA